MPHSSYIEAETEEPDTNCCTALLAFLGLRSRPQPGAALGAPSFVSYSAAGFAQPVNRTEPASAGGPVSARSADVAVKQAEVERALHDLVSHPRFIVRKELIDHCGSISMVHPDLPSGSILHRNVGQLGHHHFKFDFGLNGKVVPRFNPFSIIRNHACQQSLAELGVGPAAAVQVVGKQILQEERENGVTTLVQPVAISASRTVEGIELTSSVREAVRLYKGMPAALAAAYVFAMDDVFDRQRGVVHNVIAEPGGVVKIIDGWAGGAEAIKLKQLPERSIRKLFGIERGALENILDTALARGQAFYQSNRDALRHIAPDMAADPQAAAPMETFIAYLAQCKARIDTLED